MSIPDDPKRPSRPPTGRFGRLARLGALGTRAVPLAIAGVKKRLSGEIDEEEQQRQREKILKEAKKTAEAMLKTLGEMKGLPLKIGQMASYIDGLAPPGYEEKFQEVLKRLQAKAPPLSPEAAEKVIKSELGAPPEEIFAEFEREPFAAASIGQVHRARLRSGERVAVKVQYPGIDTAIENDLKTVAVMEQMIAPIGRRYQSKEGLEEIKRVFLAEIDYTQEAVATDAFRAFFADDPSIVIPRVVHSLTTKRVLVNEYIDGIDYHTFTQSAPWSQRHVATKTIWKFMFRSLYEYGTLYADPHPGNYRFIVSKDDDVKIGFLDFGCVRVLSDQMIAGMKRVILARMRRDDDEFSRALVEVYGFDPTDEEGWPLYKTYTEQLIRPLTDDEPFLHTKEVARENVAFIVRGERKIVWKKGEVLPNLPKPLKMPVENTFVNRLQWGLTSVLAGLEADYNFHRLTLPWILGARKPPPGLTVPDPV
ncbi:MAG: AarF/ABC1/UbiB kinase family protein [Deltaproteobacteria bacterium]|nr:AarF/ABC1/UbiB kinase family protein [Deltaproteobacteria bacterium]